MPNYRTILATGFSLVLIGGAYALAHGVAHPSVAQASTESALLAQIAAKDSDNDGLPDWEEALYGTDPTNPDTRGLGMTDGEAVAKGLIVPVAVADVPVATSTVESALDPSLTAPTPGSLTDLFAQDFFTQYTNAKQQNGGDALTQDQMNAVVQQTLGDLASAATQAPPYKIMANLSVAGSDNGALITFAANAEEAIISKTNSATTSEINYLKEAVQDDNAGALTYIAQISKTYRDMAAGLAQIPVPGALADNDLALMNAFMRLAELTNDFTKYQSDPVSTMLALQLYPQAVQDMGNALIGIWHTYDQAQITFSDGQPGARFVNLIPHIAKEQQASAGATSP